MALSDSHKKHLELQLDLEGVDIIIHAGDFTTTKTPAFNHGEGIEFFKWFEKLPVKHKIVIPGNHDTSISAGMHGDYKEIEKNFDLIFLNHRQIEIEGIKIFGSPYTPSFGVGWAYNCDRGKIGKYWSEIPRDTDILITHGPPYGILDAANRGRAQDFELTGCKLLMSRVKTVKPKYHIFGHIHEDAGKQLKIFNSPTTFINAAVVDLQHKLFNPYGIHFEISNGSGGTPTEL